MKILILSSLIKYHRKFYAEDGKPGSSARKRGLSGDDIYLHLPLGHRNLSNKRKWRRIKIADITAHNEEIILAHGGRGGKEIVILPATNQAPRMATPGRKTKEIVLEHGVKTYGRCWSGRFSLCWQIHAPECPFLS
jgi:GTP-binding protein